MQGTDWVIGVGALLRSNTVRAADYAGEGKACGMGEGENRVEGRG